LRRKRYPVATLIGQAAGSLLLAAEAVLRDPPDVLVDTTGLHFCLPLLRLLGVSSLACYVHYPLVTSEMLDVVASRRQAHNNRGVFATYAAGALLKLTYYRALLFCYRQAGRQSDVTIVNGSWTAGHISKLWQVTPIVVFPPCDTRSLEGLPLVPPGGRGRVVLSIAQFRPEKDHALQIRAFVLLLRKWRAAGSPAPRPALVLAGAVRHAADQDRLDALTHLAATLLAGPDGSRGDVDAVRFAPNLSMAELHAAMGSASVGLHTMWNEHFGIGVVEMLAAGLAVIAHNSGGPALDIIEGGHTGMLASTEEEYADAMAQLLVDSGAPARAAAMAEAGRRSVGTRFSETAFGQSMGKALDVAMKL
jgi:alpha-1,2-mannosyltransferase